jgi:hypothetical protein
MTAPDLGVTIHSADRHGPLFWAVTVADTGRPLGTWVPSTGSVRVGPTMHAGVVDSTAAMTLFAEYAAAVARLPAHVSEPFLCRIG